MQRVPILVGITGKRDLRGQDELVRRRLRETFDILDRETPHAPKVLLSGLAIGADTIAVELAVARPDWLVAAILPFDREIYLEDFSDIADPPAAAGKTPPTQRETIAKWLADPKVRTYALPALRNPATGARCTEVELSELEDSSNPLRKQHYEQLGLWLARTATLLIAVLPEDEEPDKPGGTARVVSYRLNGRPDAVARLVMEASAVVCPPLTLDIAALGPIWLIDAPLEHPGSSRRRHPFLIRLHDRDEHSVTDRWSFRERLRISLTVARGLDGLARLATAEPGPSAWRQSAGDAIAIVSEIHLEIDRIQGSHKKLLTRSSYALAALFWLAVVTYGLVELTREEAGRLNAPGLLFYLALVAGAVVWHGALERKRWQRIAEDYRGVNEALRVQRAWWHAGLVGPEAQVDRYYLAGVLPPIHYLRQAVRNIVGWTQLNAGATPMAADWQQVYDPKEPKQAKSWMREQIDYFKGRAADRKRSVMRSQMLIWELFFSAQFLAVWLSIDAVSAAFLPIATDKLMWWSNGTVRAAIFLVAATAFWVLRHVPTRQSPPQRRWTAAFAVAMALLIGPGLHFLAEAVMPDRPNAGHLAVAFGVIMLSAAAVSVRFVAEKLVWEAEAHRYDDALALFERAAGELDRIAAEGDPPDRSLKRRQEVVLALGQAALEENEYWLRAHRERPVEQAVG